MWGGDVSKNLALLGKCFSKYKTLKTHMGSSKMKVKIQNALIDTWSSNIKVKHVR